MMRSGNRIEQNGRTGICGNGMMLVLVVVFTLLYSSFIALTRPVAVSYSDAVEKVECIDLSKKADNTAEQNLIITYKPVVAGTNVYEKNFINLETNKQESVIHVSAYTNQLREWTASFTGSTRTDEFKVKNTDVCFIYENPDVSENMLRLMSIDKNGNVVNSEANNAYLLPKLMPNGLLNLIFFAAVFLGLLNFIFTKFSNRLWRIAFFVCTGYIISHLVVYGGLYAATHFIKINFLHTIILTALYTFIFEMIYKKKA